MTTFKITILEDPKPSDDPLFLGVKEVIGAVFSPMPGVLEARLSERKNTMILVAHDDTGVVGFKIGYQDSPEVFHSWLGGVHPHARKRGIASALMQAQHDWALEKGYTYLTTNTENKWRDMLLLNIRHGFDIIGTSVGKRNEIKIMLRKKLKE